MDRFIKLVKKYREMEDEKENRRQVKEIEASVRAAMEHYNRKEVEASGQTTQLVKARYLPIWSGQNYKRWRMEVERWSTNNKASV